MLSWPVVRELLSWYTTKVSRRPVRGQSFKPGHSCYLYEYRAGGNGPSGQHLRSAASELVFDEETWAHFQNEEARF